MTVTHYADADGQTVTMCGRRPSPALEATQTEQQVTCSRCRGSMRWLIHFHGMSWEQANKHMQDRAKREREFLYGITDRPGDFGNIRGR